MKKLFIFLLTSITLLCSCSRLEDDAGEKNEHISEDFKSDACDFLTDANWEGRSESCTNVIDFGEDGSFSNWCYCGSPIGDSDLYEEFRYRASDQTIFLLGSDGEQTTGNVLFVDSYYLVIDLWNQIYVYENLDATES